MKQLQLHKKIDEILKQNPQNIKKEDVSGLMPEGNFDAKDYFFAQADERWLDWLWQNNFLDNAIKKQPEDITRYGYQTPEIGYLVRMAKVAPEKVVKIILDKDTATSEKKFKPELVDQFSRICAELPARYLVKIIPKIKRQNWLKLMSAFRSYGFEYAKMFEILYKAGEIKSLLDLAEVVLSVKSEKELKEKTIKFGGTEFPADIDNPFYFKYSSYIKVFDYLAKIEDEKYLEQAFGLVAKIMVKVIEARKKEGKDKVFAVYDSLLLLDEDFFEIDLKERTRSPRENTANLAAVIKILAEKFIKKNCQSSPQKVKEFFKKYIGEFDDKNALLPDSRAMWRLRLAVLSLCPSAFRKELKKAFFRLCSVKRYYNEIISGTEYLKALRAGFRVLSDSDKRDYVKRVIEYFVKKDKEKENEKEDWHIRYGLSILSMIANQLTEEEKKKAEKEGFTINPDIQPEPSVKMGRVGTIIPQAPLSYEEFQKTEVSVIAEKLRSEWSPKELYKKYKEKAYFHHPINAEGVGEYIKKNIPEKLQDYIGNADKFFNRKEIDPHYTYSFLRGIQEAIRDNKTDLSNINWDNLLKLFLSIKDSNEKESFSKKSRDRNRFDGWLANWTAVHSIMVDVIQELIREKNGSVVIDFKKYRRDIFKVLKYLLHFPDPTPADEQIETAKSKTKSPNDLDYLVSDPYTMAINTVRGSAFEALVMFIFQDGKIKFTKDDKIQIADDVKNLYKEILEKEQTRALMFMFGRYLPSFYYRDKNWIKKLLPQIFPADKQYLFLAATEGYLTQSLYKELFFDNDFQKLYQQWIRLAETKYPNQKHFKDIDETLADHLALAFIYFDVKFDKNGFKDKLLKEFWNADNKNNQKRYYEFISFVGRHVLSRDNADMIIKRHDKINLKRIEKFWDWVLKNKNVSSNPKILTGFGYWINPNEEIIKDKILAKKLAKTLEKSEGQIDWEYGLIKRLSSLAKVAPDDTLEIIKNYLLDKDNNLIANESRMPIYEEEYKQALEIVYSQGDNFKQKTTELVNTLIAKGGRPFWPLKEVIK